MSLEAYKQRLEREMPNNPPPTDVAERVYDVYSMELFGKIKLFLDISAEVFEEPYLSEVKSKVNKYLQQGTLYKTPDAFDKAIDRIKDGKVDFEPPEEMRDKVIRHFNAVTLHDEVVQRTKDLSKKIPLILGPEVFYQSFVMSLFTLPKEPEVDLISDIFDSITNPLIDFHNYMLSEFYDPKVAYEKSKGVKEIAEVYIKKANAIPQKSSALKEITDFLTKLTFIAPFLEEKDNRTITFSTFGMVYTEDIDDETAAIFREMLQVDLNEKELDLVKDNLEAYTLRGGLTSNKNKPTLVELRDLLKSVEDRKTKLENFGRYFSYNRLAESLGLPKLSLDEFSQASLDNLSFILKEKYRLYLTKDSINRILGDSGLGDLFLYKKTTPQKSIVRPSWEDSNKIMRLSLIDSDTDFEEINLGELDVDIPSMIGKAIRLTQRPKRFYHKNRQVIQRIKNGEYEVSEVKGLLSKLRSDLSDNDRFHLVEGDFLSILGELDNNNILKMSGITSRDKQFLYLKNWERDFNTDSISGYGYHCCFRGKDIANYIENSNVSIYEIWNNGYRFGGVFVLDTSRSDGSPSFAIDSIECHPRLFSNISDRFGWDYPTSVKNAVNKIVKGIGLKAVAYDRELVVAPNSAQKEIKKTLGEICQNYGSDILKFDKKDIYTDIRFKSLPKQIDLSKIEL